MESLNEKIRRIRKDKGISQVEVAKASGINQASYSNIEKGSTTSISIEVGKGIAKALKISFNELFDIEVAESGDNLQGKIRELENKISELRDQLNDKRELLKYYQQSYTVTERMIIIQSEDFHKLCPDVAFSIDVGELRDRAMKELQRQYPDLFIVKSSFLLRKDSENTNSK